MDGWEGVVLEHRRAGGRRQLAAAAPWAHKQPPHLGQLRTPVIGSHLLLPQLHQVLLPLLLALLAMCKLPLRLLAGGVHRLQLLQALQLSVALLVQLGGHLLGQAGAGGAGSHQHQLVVGVLLPLHWGPGGWGPALGALLLVLPPWDGSESPEMRSKAGAKCAAGDLRLESPLLGPARPAKHARMQGELHTSGIPERRPGPSNPAP